MSVVVGTVDWTVLLQAVCVGAFAAPLVTWSARWVPAMPRPRQQGVRAPFVATPLAPASLWTGETAGYAVLIAAVVVALLDTLGPVPATAGFVFLIVVGLSLAAIDVAHHRLPDVVLLPSGLALVTMFAVAGWSTGEWTALGRATLAAVVCFGGHLVLAVLPGKGLGLGDVKLAGLLGLATGWLGWPAVCLGVIAGFGLGAVAATALLVSGRAQLRSPIPFGPAMLAGAATAVLLGDQFRAVAVR